MLFKKFRLIVLLGKTLNFGKFNFSKKVAVRKLNPHVNIQLYGITFGCLIKQGLNLV